MKLSPFSYRVVGERKEGEDFEQDFEDLIEAAEQVKAMRSQVNKEFERIFIVTNLPSVVWDSYGSPLSKF